MCTQAHRGMVEELERKAAHALMTDAPITELRQKARQVLDLLDSENEDSSEVRARAEGVFEALLWAEESPTQVRQLASGF